jgi:Na+-driven multidrug efflux pump
MTWLMIPFGTVALAAHNSIYRIELFITAPGLGFGFGAGVLVGQNLGAGQPRQAARSGWVATRLVVGFIIVCSAVLLIWSKNVISLFSTDSAFVELGSTFLRIAVTGYLGTSLVYAMQNCISGSGDTLPPMLITLVMLWLVQIPLAFLLSRFTGLGIYGVRWAIAISVTLGAIAYIAYFWGGRWKNKKV